MLNINFLLLLFFTFNLFANDAHYKNVLVGDRAATMGGAFVGISDDASGSYYNPSGIVYLSGTNISGSANVYHVQHTEYKGAIGTNDWVRHSSELIPNFFSIIRKFSDFSLGFSFVIPDSFVQHQDQVFDSISGTVDTIDRFTLNLHHADLTNLVGPTVAYKISDSFSIGLSLYYHYRKSRMQNYQLVEFANNTNSMSYYNADYTEKGFFPKLGFMWSPFNAISLGLTFSKTFLFSSATTVFANVKNVSDINVVMDTYTDNLTKPTATQISFGTAYFVSPFLLFSADLDFYYIKVYKNVLNFSTGSEYFFNEKNAVRIGFFTNLSCKTEPSASTTGLEKIDLYGFTTGYSFYQKSSSITLGLTYSFGNGNAQIYQDSSRIIKLNRYSYTGTISASYAF